MGCRRLEYYEESLPFAIAGSVWEGAVVGSISAGIWFVADYGTMGVNYFMGNGCVIST
jgi:hypothetical protein